MADMRIAERLAQVIGVPYRYPERRDIWQWDRRGRGPAEHRERYAGERYLHSWTGTEVLVPASMTGDQLVHEICHWMVADPARRSLPEFGLGEASWKHIVSFDPGYRALEYTKGPAQRRTSDAALEALLDAQWSVGADTSLRSITARSYDEALAGMLSIYTSHRLGWDWRGEVDGLGRGPHVGWAVRHTFEEVADDRHYWDRHSPLNNRRAMKILTERCHIARMSDAIEWVVDSVNVTHAKAAYRKIAADRAATTAAQQRRAA